MIYSVEEAAFFVVLRVWRRWLMRHAPRTKWKEQGYWMGSDGGCCVVATVVLLFLSRCLKRTKRVVYPGEVYSDSSNAGLSRMMERGQRI